MRINIKKTIKAAEKIKSDLVSCKTGADLIKLMEEQEKISINQRYNIVYAVDADTHKDIDLDNINPDTAIEEIGLGMCNDNIDLPVCNPQTGFFTCTVCDEMLNYQYSVIEEYLDAYKIKDDCEPSLNMIPGAVNVPIEVIEKNVTEFYERIYGRNIKDIPTWEEVARECVDIVEDAAYEYDDEENWEREGRPIFYCTDNGERGCEELRFVFHADDLEEYLQPETAYKQNDIDTDEAYRVLEENLLDFLPGSFIESIDLEFKLYKVSFNIHGRYDTEKSDYKSAIEEANFGLLSDIKLTDVSYYSDGSNSLYSGIVDGKFCMNVIAENPEKAYETVHNNMLCAPFGELCEITSDLDELYCYDDKKTYHCIEDIENEIKEQEDIER